MKTCLKIVVLIFVLMHFNTVFAQTAITGELRKWHKVTLTFEGPETSEKNENNPFLNYRLNVTFTQNNQKFVVPGYFAADGNAANSSASSGNQWRVHFAPNTIGEWQYEVSFRKGDNIAVNDDQNAGESAGFMDQETGSFIIKKSNKSGKDLRGKGLLQYVGKHYLQFAENGEYFLKAGVDAPENLLSFVDFDGDFKTDGHKDKLVKTWEAHLKDWKEGDPVWQENKGKALIGAINYLASKGLNVFSFLTLNIVGDDQNVFPYIDYDTYDRMDVSRLDQWEIIFEHADKLGMYLHFKTQEAENQGLLDNGDVGTQRKLYYRELIARFSHHLALNWNLGEENGPWMKNHPTPPQTTAQRKAMAKYFAEHDPYQHLIVIHNGQSFDDLLGKTTQLTGASVQTNKADFRNVHRAVLGWIRKSDQAGKPWVVACDEPGDAQHSLVPDDENPNHDNARKNALWGTLMAGGAGIEWYFGYKHPHSDLSCQDWRSRDKMWDQSRIAIEFFQKNKIPFWEMKSMDNLTSNEDDYCFIKENEIYLIYLKAGKAFQIDLSQVTKKMKGSWFNPKTGNFVGKSFRVSPGKQVNIPAPPSENDWLLYLH